MDSDTLTKIINTILSILGIWTAVSVTRMTTQVGDAASTVQASFSRLPGGSYVQKGKAATTGEIPPSLHSDGQAGEPKERVTPSDAGRH